MLQRSISRIQTPSLISCYPASNCHPLNTTIDFRHRIAITATSNKPNSHDPFEKEESLITHSRRIRGQCIARLCAPRKNSAIQFIWSKSTIILSGHIAGIKTLENQGGESNGNSAQGPAGPSNAQNDDSSDQTSMSSKTTLKRSLVRQRAATSFRLWLQRHACNALRPLHPKSPATLRRRSLIEAGKI